MNVSHGNRTIFSINQYCQSNSKDMSSSLRKVYFDSIDEKLHTITSDGRSVLKLCFGSLFALRNVAKTSSRKSDCSSLTFPTFPLDLVYIFWSELIGIKSYVRNIYNQRDANSSDESETNLWKYLIRENREQTFTSILQYSSRLSSIKHQFSKNKKESSLMEHKILHQIVTCLSETGFIEMFDMETSPSSNVDNNSGKISFRKGHITISSWFKKNTSITPDLIYKNGRKTKFVRVKKPFIEPKDVVRMSYPSMKQEYDSFEILHHVASLALGHEIEKLIHVVFYNGSYNINEWDLFLITQSNKSIYALKFISSHMMKAKLFDDAIGVLTRNQLIYISLRSLGVVEATYLHVQNCENLYKMINLHGKQKLKPKILTALKAIGKMLKDNIFDRDEESGKALQLVANGIAKLGWKKESIRFHNSSIITLKQVKDSNNNHISLIETLHSVAEICVEIKKFKNALNYYEQAFALQKKYVEEGCPEGIADTSKNIAFIYKKFGYHEKATKLYEESIYYSGIVLKTDDLEFAGTLFELGKIYFRMQLFEKAIRNTKDSLVIREKHLPDSFLLVAETYHKLGIYQWKKCEYENAISSCDKAQNMLRDKQGCADKNVLDNAHLIGNAYTCIGKIDKSIQYLSEAVAIAKERNESDDVETASILKDLAFVYTKNEQYSDAIKIMSEVVVIFESNYGRNHEKVSEA